jgi:hypothetical protein
MILQTMMASFTHFSKSIQLKKAITAVQTIALIALFIFSFTQQAFGAGQDGPVSASISVLQVERIDGALHANAQLKFELPTPIEDVLLKGIPLVFVAEAEVRRDRWYWYDKKLVVATRYMRLAYQPLTRRWRLNISNSVGANSASGALANGLGGGLPQYFDTLPEALLKVQRFNRWRIVELSELDADTLHTLEINFKLDTSQLPRPFQLGLIGQSDWNISASKRIRFASEVSK